MGQGFANKGTDSLSKSKKSGKSANNVFTHRYYRPLVVRCIIMDYDQTTNAPS